MDKASLRRRLRERRAKSVCDGLIARRVCSLEEFKNARVVFSYLDFGSEVPTREILTCSWQAGKTVVLPRCGKEPHSLEWYEVDSLEGLVRSRMGMDEPKAESARRLEPSACDGSPIAIVPGLGFDTSGYRLGYGGGYYDAFLASFEGVSVGLCREEEVVESLGMLGVLEPHDIAVNIVVTEARRINCGL